MTCALDAECVAFTIGVEGNSYANNCTTFRDNQKVGYVPNPNDQSLWDCYIDEDKNIKADKLIEDEILLLELEELEEFFSFYS